MLKLRYLFENFALARLALERYAHDSDSLEECLRWFRISANAVYPYRNGGNLCFLRLAPVEEKSLSLVQGEIEWIGYLREKGYPAMKPIGEAWVLGSPWGRWCVSAFEGVAGKPVEACPPNDAMFFAMGAALARMHALCRDYQPANRRPDHRQVLGEIRHMLRENHAPSAVEEQLNALEAALCRLPETPETYGLLHYDFEPDNVFWDEKTQTCAVTDFDDSIYGWFALDVEQALCELPDENACQRFMEGYRSVLPFTEDMERQRPLMRRFIDLRSYARLCHCLNDGISNPPEWMLALCPKLEGFRVRLEQEILSQNP